MDVTTPILHFFVFHFLVENKENQLYFRLFSPWYVIPLKELSKTQKVEKANFYRVFPVSGTYKRFPLATV